MTSLDPGVGYCSKQIASIGHVCRRSVNSRVKGAIEPARPTRLGTTEHRRNPSKIVKLGQVSRPDLEIEVGRSNSLVTFLRPNDRPYGEPVQIAVSAGSTEDVLHICRRRRIDSGRLHDEGFPDLESIECVGSDRPTAAFGCPLTPRTLTGRVSGQGEQPSWHANKLADSDPV